MTEHIRFPKFVSFISSPSGRGARVLLGIALITYGYRTRSKGGTPTAILGMLPLAAGLFDVCILGRVFGGYFQGDAMRSALHRQVGFPQLGSDSASWMKA